MTGSGGSNGIGASLAELCCQNDAYVCIGDIDRRGQSLAKKCRDRWPAIAAPNMPPKPPRCIFQSVDVTDYQAVLGLFDTAFRIYKQIDHVVVTAGSMSTTENWFDPNLSLKAVRQVRWPLPAVLWR